MISGNWTLCWVLPHALSCYQILKTREIVRDVLQLGFFKIYQFQGQWYLEEKTVYKKISLELLIVVTNIVFLRRPLVLMPASLKNLIFLFDKFQMIKKCCSFSNKELGSQSLEIRFTSPNLSCVTYHMVWVTCQVSHVTCHVTHVPFFTKWWNWSMEGLFYSILYLAHT